MKSAIKLLRRIGIENAVTNAKECREWSVEYMTLYELRQIDREEGRKEGRKEGRDEASIRIYYKEMKLKPEEIARKIGKPVEYVKNVIENLDVNLKS